MILFVAGAYWSNGVNKVDMFMICNKFRRHLQMHFPTRHHSCSLSDEGVFLRNIALTKVLMNP